MRRTFNPATSLLAGRSNAALQADLAVAQQAYIDLQGGAKVVSVSYAQGSGSRSVTYTQASIADVQNLIRSLQSQLGIIQRARRPIRVVF